MVKPLSVREESFNQLNVTPATPYVLSVLVQVQANVPHAELVLTLRDGLVQRHLVLVTWLHLVLASQSKYLGQTEESIQGTSGLSMMQKHRLLLFRVLVEPV